MTDSTKLILTNGKKVTINYGLETLKYLRSCCDRKAIVVLLLRNTDTFNDIL